jgi:hypothetical protein
MVSTASTAAYKPLRRFCLTSLFLLLSLASWGQWQRILFSGKGELRDMQTPHPLSYYTSNPSLRDDGADLYDDCDNCGTTKSKAGSAKNYAVTTEVRDVGTVSGFRVVAIFYEFVDRRKPDLGKMRWKSILVQTGRDKYVEIYHLQAYYLRAPLTPVKLVHVSDELVLMTQDSDGGNGGGCWEAYWWFDASGPLSIDFSLLVQEIRKHVPPDSKFWTTCWALHLEEQEVKSYVQKADARCRACDGLGEVTAHFRLNGARAEPTDVSFAPAPE